MQLGNTFFDQVVVAPFNSGWPALPPEPGATGQRAPSATQDVRCGPRGGRKPMRSRQRALAQLEAELQSKLSEYRVAMEERNKLQQRIKVLEVVLPMREQQVQVLKQRQQAPHPSTNHSSVLHITELASSGSNSGMSSAAEVVIAKALPEVASEQDLTAPGRCTSARSDSPFPLDPVCYKLHVQCGPCGTPGHVIRQFMSVWNQWVRETGLVLHTHDSRPHDPGPQLKLAALRERLSPALRAMRMEYPLLPMDVVGVNMETGERGEPVDTHWESVVQALRFSPEQVADCRAALALFRERVELVAAERESLTSQVTSCLEAYRWQQQQHQRRFQHQRQQQQRQQGADEAPSSCGELALRLIDTSAQLQRNVLAEGQVVEVIKDFMGSSLFSLVQLVRASVLCYPFFPDAIAIISTVAEVAPVAAGDAV